MCAQRLMYPMLACTLVCLVMTSCRQRESSASEVDQRNGRLHQEDDKKPFTGILTENYPDGSPKSRSHVRDGLLHGISEGWFPDGTREIEEFFVKGVSHGSRTRWHPNGKLASKALVADGEISGKFQRWHTNGALAEEIAMLAGKPNGMSKSFRPDGTPIAEVLMKDDKIVSQKYWDTDGGEQQ